MRIASFRFCPYELPLAKPWRTSQGTITARYGCLVAFHSTHGETGLGDLAPLAIPDMETSAAIMQILERLRDTRWWPRLERDMQRLDPWLAELHLHFEKFPDLIFALQCALAGLIADRGKKHFRSLLSGTAPISVPVNAVISEEAPDEIIAAAERAVADGYHTLKIKLGSHPVAEDLKLLATLRERFPKTKLRVDANGAWTVRDAVKFCRDAHPLHVEYVEDPLRVPSPQSLKSLQRQEFVPVALDDAAVANDELLSSEAAQALRVHVIKPARFGAFSSLRMIATRAELNKTSIVITGSLESSIGLSYVAGCAAAYGDLHRAQGLATAQWLAEDTTTSSVLPLHGNMQVPDVWELPKLLRPQYQDELGIER